MTTRKYPYDLQSDETPDIALREIAGSRERELVNAVSGLVSDSFRDFFRTSLEVALPDASTQRWILAFQTLAGDLRLVVYEENAAAGSGKLLVAPPVPLADAGLAPLVFFLPRLDDFFTSVMGRVVGKVTETQVAMDMTMSLKPGAPAKAAREPSRSWPVDG
jgi:hypothetical protein